MCLPLRWTTAACLLTVAMLPERCLAQVLPGYTVISLCRQEPAGNELKGELWVDGELVGTTMENNDLRIAEGSYTGLLRYYSAKGHVQGVFGNLATQGDFLLEVGGAKSPDNSARTNILFHAGTRPHHSKGCILLGAARPSAGGKAAVPGSALVALRKKFYGTEFPDKTPDVKIQIFVSKCSDLGVVK